MRKDELRKQHLEAMLSAWREEATIMKASPILCVALVPYEATVKPVIMTPGDIEASDICALLRALADRIEGGYAGKASVRGEVLYDVSRLINAWLASQGKKGKGDVRDN